MIPSLFYSFPLQLGATFFFILSVIHAFLTPRLYNMYLRIRHQKILFPERKKKYLVLTEITRMFSRIELVMLLWSVPFLLWFVYSENYKVMIGYLTSRNYMASLFIIVMMILVESNPIIYLSETLLNRLVQKIGKHSPVAWWWVILLVSPMLSSLLKETGAMVIATMLLIRKFYIHNPSKKFAYATMGLLFSNISIGGLLTITSSRAMFMIMPTLKWSSHFIWAHFTWKAFLAILFSTTIYYLYFKKELKEFVKTDAQQEDNNESIKAPWWVVCIHICFVWALLQCKTSPVLIISVFLCYLCFRCFTYSYQNIIDVNKACLIGLFYSGLVILGDLQEWWVLKLMQNQSDFGHMIISFGLSIFLDNALVNYLVHNLSVSHDCYHYLVITGCMAAGGLTVATNLPNIVGYTILRRGLKLKLPSLVGLFLAAIIPASINFFVFWFLRNIPLFTSCR